MDEVKRKPTVHGEFVKERVCKHSTRYKAKDEVSAALATVIYVSNEALMVLEYPQEITVTLKAV